MELSEQIKNEIIRDIKIRIYEESFPRIKQCIELLDEDKIWLKPNKNSNSIGNLVLHLCGNIRQYLLSGIAGEKDIRVRHLEFSESGTVPVGRLTDLMDELLLDVSNVLYNIKTEDLLKIKEVQGFTMTGISILVHVTEHLSYHTGQIAFYTKLLEDTDLKFYGDLDLDVKSN